ncbi:hypothetical protein Fmac_015309 [Flemingia macrophylla]|uniref:Uncharacterized protein n=1 Tax=Flemingia macrophylla TaxID=520843 RepID=A0ABD1ME94_9FABA
MMPLSLEEFMMWLRDTSVEARKQEGKLDALVNLVTQLATNQKPASVARVCDIRSSNDNHTSLSARNVAIVIRGVHDVATDTSIEARKQEGKLDALVTCVKNDAIVIRGVHVQATDTSAEARKLEGKLDALVNLVTQLAANQKPASVPGVCDIRSSNDHHTSVCPSSQQSGVDEHPEAYAANTYSRPPTRKRDKALDREDGSQLLVTRLAANKKPASVARVGDIHFSNDHHTSFSARNDAIFIRGVHEMAIDTSTEARKLEGKLHPLVNLVTQLVANQTLPLLEVFATSVLPMTTTLVSVLLRSNLELKSILRLMLQTPIPGHHSNTSAEARKLEGKLDAHVNLVTRLATNQKPACVARVCGIRSSNDHHTSFSARNDAIVIRGVDDVATDTSAEARKLEGKLDALVNLVTQLAVNQKPAYVARVCGIRSSNDYHTSGCPSLQQSGVDEHSEAYTANTYSRQPQLGVHDVARDTFAEARKLEGKLGALVNLVTRLAANQKPASIARVCGIRSSNDHHISVCPSSEQSGFSARNDAIVIRGVHDVATDTFAEARKLEGKLDALVNLLAVNQKPASVARVFGIRSSNDHHTSVCPSSQQSGFSARNDAIVIRGVHDVATDTSAEARKLEGKLDALVNLVTPLAANKKPALVTRVFGIRSSNDHHTSVCPSSQQSGVDEHPEAYFSARNDAIIIRGVHDVATDTSAEARKLEGKLDALVNLVTQLAVNQKPPSVARVCGLRSSNDHHTSVCPSSKQSGMDEQPETYAANTYSRPPQQLREGT